MGLKITDKRQVAIFIPYRQTNGDVFVFLQKRSKDAKRIPKTFSLQLKTPFSRDF